MPLGFPGGASGKKTHTHKPAGAGDIRDTGLISRLGRSPREGNGNPLLVFLLGESHGQRNLAGYSPQGCKESDTTKAT